jgi:4-amino-4-deoxy-L-arabinose transferase-like glycosyltransferase
MMKKAVIVIFIIAVFFRLFNLNSAPPGLYPDEAMNGNNALGALSTNDFKIFYPENNGREGLFANIQAVSVWLFGNYAWALRLVSALFGILTVLGIYFLGKEMFGKNVGLLSSFFTAISFWHINFSRIGFRAIMAPFFLVWGIYFLLLAYRKIKEEHLSTLNPIGNGKLRLVGYSALGGIFFGLGFHSYIAYRATPLILLFIFLFYLKRSFGFRKQIIVYSMYFLAAAFIVALPLGIYFLENPQDFFGRTAQISIFSQPNPINELATNTFKTFAMFNFVGDWNWRHNFAGQPQLQWFVGILFMLGIFIGLYEILRKPDYRDENSILFIWLIIALLPVVISSEGLPHALRAILMIPPIFIFAGRGGMEAYDFIKRRLPENFKVFDFACAILLILLAFQTYTAYFVSWANNQEVYGAFNGEWARIGNELNALPNELPKYVIVEAGGVNVRGIPMPAQTVMFLTDTFTPDKQNAKNLHYLLPGEEWKITDPERSYVVEIK